MHFSVKKLASLAAAALFAVGLSVSNVFVAPASAAGNTIVDTAMKAGQFKTLVAALTAADLVATLKGDGPFTVFAPTDAAFAALPAGTVESLLKPENKAKLVAILTYHVVPGRIMAGDLAGKKMSAKTAQGGMLEVNAMSGVMINNATVTSADIQSDNGVIHVIDKVLLPK